MMLRLLLLLGLLATPMAHADDRRSVAVLDFDGPRASSVRGEVMRIAGTASWVLSSSTLDGRSVREFAVDHDVDLVIEGSVRRRNHLYEIRIRFVDGTTGHTIAHTTVVAPRPVLDRRSKQRVSREIARALAMLPSAGAR